MERKNQEWKWFYFRKNTEKQIMFLKDFQAAVIFTTPSYAKISTKRWVVIVICHFRTIVLVRNIAPKSRNIKASNIYELSKIIGRGISNEDFEEQRTGSDIQEDHFFPEIVNEKTGEPILYG